MKLVATAIQFNDGIKKDTKKPYFFAVVQFGAPQEVIETDTRNSITYGHFHESLTIFFKDEASYLSHKRLVAGSIALPITIELTEEKYLSQGRMNIRVVGFSTTIISDPKTPKVA